MTNLTNNILNSILILIPTTQNPSHSFIHSYHPNHKAAFAAAEAAGLGNFTLTHWRDFAPAAAPAGWVAP